MEPIDVLLGGEMKSPFVFYLCPTCFYACDSPDNMHEHPLLRVDPGRPGDDRRKPITDSQGRVLSAAPVWFYEAILASKAIPRITS
jgi:hypothetical protein